MKRIVSLLICVHLSLTVGANAQTLCATTVHAPGYKPNLATIDASEIILGSNPLTSSGTVKCRTSFDFRSNSNKRHRIEAGAIGNVKYRIYLSDGSGTIQGRSSNTLDTIEDYGSNWHTRCEIDKFDDKHWCLLSRGYISITIMKDGSPLVNVGHNHYPSSQIGLRIDKNRPIVASEKTGFTKAQVATIFSQMRNGEKIITRYQEWPYQHNKDKVFDLFGFKEAWKLLQIIHQRINKSGK